MNAAEAKRIAKDALQYADDNAANTSMCFGYLWSAMARIAEDTKRTPPWRDVIKASREVQS